MSQLASRELANKCSVFSPACKMSSSEKQNMKSPLSDEEAQVAEEDCNGYEHTFLEGEICPFHNSVSSTVL